MENPVHYYCIVLHMVFSRIYWLKLELEARAHRADEGLWHHRSGIPGGKGLRSHVPVCGPRIKYAILILT